LIGLDPDPHPDADLDLALALDRSSPERRNRRDLDPGFGPVRARSARAIPGRSGPSRPAVRLAVVRRLGVRAVAAAPALPGRPSRASLPAADVHPESPGEVRRRLRIGDHDHPTAIAAVTAGAAVPAFSSGAAFAGGRTGPPAPAASTRSASAAAAAGAAAREDGERSTACIQQVQLGPGARAHLHLQSGAFLAVAGGAHRDGSRRGTVLPVASVPALVAVAACIAGRVVTRMEPGLLNVVPRCTAEVELLVDAVDPGRASRSVSAGGPAGAAEIGDEPAIMAGADLQLGRRIRPARDFHAHACWGGGGHPRIGRKAHDAVVHLRPLHGRPEAAPGNGPLARALRDQLASVHEDRGRDQRRRLARTKAQALGPEGPVRRQREAELADARPRKIGTAREPGTRGAPGSQEGDTDAHELQRTLRARARQGT